MDQFRAVSFLLCIGLTVGCTAGVNQNATSVADNDSKNSAEPLADQQTPDALNKDANEALAPSGPAIYKLLPPGDLSKYPLIFLLEAPEGQPVSSLEAVHIKTTGLAGVHVRVEAVAPLRYSVRLEALTISGAFTIAVVHPEMANTAELRYENDLSMSSHTLLPITISHADTALTSPHKTVGQPVPIDLTFNFKMKNDLATAISELKIEGAGVHLDRALVMPLPAGATIDEAFSVEFLPGRLNSVLQVLADGHLLFEFQFAVEDPVLPLIWMDAADLTTLYADRSCTVPVTELANDVGCWTSKGSVPVSVAAESDAKLLAWKKDSNIGPDVPAVEFTHLRPLNSGTIIRNQLGPVHGFLTFTRPTPGNGHHWQRMLSFSDWAAGCSNDGNEHCVAFGADWSGGGAPVVVEPQIAEYHFNSGKKLLHFNMGRNSMFNSEFLEGEIGEAMVFGDALPHEKIFAVRQRLARKIKSERQWLFPSNYFD